MYTATTGAVNDNVDGRAVFNDHTLFQKEKQKKQQADTCRSST